jgi:hypothetical protein
VILPASDTRFVIKVEGLGISGIPLAPVKVIDKFFKPEVRKVKIARFIGLTAWTHI